MTCNTQLEKKLLQISTLSSLIFAFIGIGLGHWIGSLVIIFDGTYSLVSLCLTAVSLAAAVWIRHPNAVNGFIPVEKIAPMVVAFKGVVITVMCAFSFHAAVVELLAGGHGADSSLTVVFGIVNFIGCFACYRVMIVMGKKVDSTLVEAESKQWIMDTIISAAVLVGFVLSAVMVLLGHQEYAVYADPMMVILASLYFGIVPIKMIMGALKELRYGECPLVDTDSTVVFLNKAS